MGTDLIDLKGVGPALVSKLQKLKVHNQYDLLFLLPIRYEDKTSLHKISALVAGEKALIQGFIVLTTVVYRGRRMLISQLSDDTGIITLRFFNFSKQQARRLAKNTVVRCFGQTRKTASGLEMIHPEYQIINPENPAPLEAGLTPIYPTTEGLQQGRLRKIVRAALEQQIDTIEELLPASIVKELGLVPLTESLREIHQPSQKNIVNDHQSLARKRLIIEELLANQLALKRLKRYTKKEPAMVLANRLLKESLIKNLPFILTKSQARVVEEIEMDLKKNQPMMRLLQGDVGSGKTIVAALAMLIAVGSKQQAALMAPTELLAEQHFNTVVSWFEPLGVSVALLKSKLSAKDRRTVFAGVANGTIDIIVGTHALFQPSVVYKNLALVVVDEQHRFGVEQRLSLMKKSNDRNTVPHQLIMTATPIPRTLAMTAYGDLDASIITELPKGRGNIKTIVVPEEKRSQVMDKISKECALGRQSYWVCPLIEESEELNFQAAESTYVFLQEKLKRLSIGLVHGKLSSVKKIKAMENFINGNTNILVATTVIEVGVDVANSSVMVIENAERLGLTQLHQLRGRIGRGRHESICILLYKKPLSLVAKERLAVIRATNDGFLIAEKDLQLRGPGELLGTRQKGLIGLRIADIMRDAYLLPAINKLTVNIEQNHPDLIEKIVRRWVGDQLEYRNV
jgi:ATP-dependent DNA helicase RecG|tara:strand:- start:1122 stop:3173 length:2052 start_codon:yes stop_codon:yes gene_type:complete